MKWWVRIIHVTWKVTCLYGIFTGCVWMHAQIPENHWQCECSKSDDPGTNAGTHYPCIFRNLCVKGAWKVRTARGRDRIRCNELRRENWTSRRFHTDYFNIEYLFWTWLTSFKSRHLSFLYIYFSSIWGQYSRRFRLFYLRVCEERWQRQSRQRTHPVYFINFRKAHYFVVIMTIQK